MTDLEWTTLVSEAALQPRLLSGAPALPCTHASSARTDDAVRAVLAELAATRAWSAYEGPALRRLSDSLGRIHEKLPSCLCCSGTVGVELGLKGLNVGPGDEVILSAYDFRGNFSNVCHLGATPVLVDLRPEDGQVDPEQIASAVTGKTRAVVVSHLHGGIVDMPRVREIADSHGIGVLEDACQAPGAEVAGRPAGGWGDVAVWSFGGSKLVSAGRGGAVASARDDVLQRVRVYSRRGNDAYPLSELQAAVVEPQWERLAEDNARRAQGAQWLCEALREAKVDSLVPWVRAFEGRAFYKLGFWYDASRAGGLSRDAFAAAVRAEGVPLDPGFRALHLSHARRRYRAVGPLPHATAADASVLTLHHSLLLADRPAILAAAAAIARVAAHGEEIRRRGLPEPVRPGGSLESE